MERNVKRALRNIGAFSGAVWPRYRLRGYQARVAEAIARSVMSGAGRQFAVVFARQSGKDEMLAQLEAFLMMHRQLGGGTLAVVNPTLRPQGYIGRRRLAERLGVPPFRGVRTEGQTLLLGQASCSFLTAHPQAQARGETATTLLVCNEAQDVDAGRWDAVFDPMGAAHHATQVFSGTVWTHRTLLARQMAYLEELERKDGIKRVFRVGWEEVARDVPAYGEQVRARIAQFGRNHPYIRTEYFLEELDGEGRLFGPARRAQMRGDHPRRRSAAPGRVYAMLLDVAGADESGEGVMGRERDATALTVVEVDTASMDDPLVMRPVYRVVDRRLWVGTAHPQLLAAIVDLARNVWVAQRVVVDATGVGAGLAGFLERALPGRVTQFVFSAQSKSHLGWDFLGLVESGRYKEYVEDGEVDTGLFWAQVEECGHEVGGGPNRPLRWGVASRTTHDDLLVSAAMCAVLDREDWRPRIARGR